MNNYYSNGKFLLSGEYLVMNGAKALAVPLKYGQCLKIEESSTAKIIWQTNIKYNFWFKAEFDKHFNIIKSSDKRISNFLSILLKAAREIKPEFVGDFGYDILSEINFDINWGLGSSSTLISNVAWWANVDPFQLFNKVANGSGYDIACARSNKAILYQLITGEAEYQAVDFFPSFHEQIYFAYLGKKQNSEKSIKLFKEKAEFAENDITGVSDITNLMLKTDSLNEFGNLIVEHERIIAGLLDKTPIKNEFFNDFDGQIKSLGAWGGDFVMVTSKLPFELIKNYFNNKGINIVFKFNNIVL